jgi:hypothetical protein
VTNTAQGSSEEFIDLEHGTTLKRAKSIEQNGPDPEFREPGGDAQKAEGISFAPVKGRHGLGSATEYALGKASLFPEEGGPAILKVRMPQSLANKSLEFARPAEYFFDKDNGLPQLKVDWNTLEIKIRVP